MVEDEGKMLSACVLHIVCEKRVHVCVCVCGPCLTVCISDRVSVFVRLLISVHILPAEMSSPLPLRASCPRQQMSPGNSNWRTVCCDARICRRSRRSHTRGGEIMMMKCQVLTTPNGAEQAETRTLKV